MKSSKKWFTNEDKEYQFHTEQSFDFDPVLFDDVKQFGFCPMHKRIRVLENVGKMAEHKYAKEHFPEQYLDSKQKQESLKQARAIFKDKFKVKLGVKYYVPDPRNGGNSNTGPMIRRIFAAPAICAEIFNISVETIQLLGKCLNMINCTSFVKVGYYVKFARAAFRHLMSDLGNHGNMNANTHSLLCHGHLYIKWAQEEHSVSVGSLSENSIEMGNKLNLSYRKLFARRNSLRKENYDIFRRRLLISDYYLIIEGDMKQNYRRGNVLRLAR